MSQAASALSLHDYRFSHSFLKAFVKEVLMPKATKKYMEGNIVLAY